MSEFLQSMQMRAKEAPNARIVFPEGNDPRVLDAALKLREDGLGEPIMVHAKEADTKAMDEAGLTRVQIDEAKAQELEALLMQLRGQKGLAQEDAKKLAHDPLVYGMYLLRTGEADALVAGAVHPTADVLRAGLWLVDKEPGIQTISSSFYMVVPPFRGGEKEEVLTFADCGVVPEPTPEQLADIAIAAADARTFVVGDEPRVAFLSFSTKQSGGSHPAIDRVRDAIKIARERRPDITIAEDEMQADAALISSIGERKAPGDAVAGKANVLVFPSLDAANIAYKLVEKIVPGAHAIGPVLHGLSKPVHDLSRGARAEDIAHSATIAAVRTQKGSE